MYVGALGAGGAVAVTGATLLLPDTGSHMFLNVAIALFIGLLVWGMAYGHMQSKRLKTKKA